MGARPSDHADHHRRGVPTVASRARLATQNDEFMADYEKSILSDDGRRKLADFKAALGTFREVRGRIFEHIDRGERDQALALTRGDGFRANEEVQAALDDLFETRKALAEAAAANAEESASAVEEFSSQARELAAMASRFELGRVGRTARPASASRPSSRAPAPRPPVPTNGKVNGHANLSPEALFPLDDEVGFKDFQPPPPSTARTSGRLAHASCPRGPETAKAPEGAPPCAQRGAIRPRSRRRARTRPR